MSLKANSELFIYGLNYRDDPKRAKNWLNHYGNPYRKIIFDPKGLLAIDLGVYGVPESFLVDPTGIIRYKQVGPLSKNSWDRYFIRLMHTKIKETIA